jgi:hypothetical protein
MRRIRLTWLVIALTLTAVAPAAADATLFVGANTTPANRPLGGLAVGVGFLVVSFEFEYASSSDDANATGPSLKTGSGNILIQTPFMIHGLQPYVTAGGGLYREQLGPHSDTSVAPNTGGGVKIALAGPLRLRVDYRVFKLRSGALYSPAHRLYAGLNLKF